MAELLKHRYNQDFFDHFLKSLTQVAPKFEQDQFLADIFADGWEQLELKQRMRRISTTMQIYLPVDYKKAVTIILDLVDHLLAQQSALAFEYMFLPDFVEVFGQDDYATSILAMENITQFTSCEFTIRPFIIKNPERTMEQMLAWSEHDHHCVRRLASEGCRPRLPWAMALPALKIDPNPILPILENLKDDNSEFVRKSVANNLNDISKDNPELVIRVVKEWQGNSAQTDWIIKHGSRTLLKQGNQEVMKIFGFGSTKNIDIKTLSIKNDQVIIGSYLEFQFELHNHNVVDTKLRLEYAIYYQKANATLSKKVYKISEKVYAPSSVSQINKRQAFKPISTRKFHFGLHQLAIIVNGIEYEPKDFWLLA